MSYTTKKFKTVALTGYLTYRYYLPPGFGEENNLLKLHRIMSTWGGGNETYCDNIIKTILIHEKYRFRVDIACLMCIVAPATNEMANGTRGRLFRLMFEDKLINKLKLY